MSDSKRDRRERYTLPAPPTPRASPVTSPVPSFARRTPSTRFTAAPLDPVSEVGGRANSDGARPNTPSLDITLSTLSKGAIKASTSSGNGNQGSNGEAGTGGNPNTSQEQPTTDSERSTPRVTTLTRRVKRSFTDGDLGHSGDGAVAITVNHTRNRSGLGTEEVDFFDVIRDQPQSFTEGQARNRSFTVPHGRTSFARAEASFPRVLSAVKELENSLAEEKLDEISNVTNLKELDKKIVNETLSPRHKPSLAESTDVFSLSEKGSLRARSSGLASPSSSHGTALADEKAYGDYVTDKEEDPEDDDDMFLSKSLPLDRVAPLCQKCAAICTLNIMHGKEYTLRSATETKLFIYQVVTSKLFHLSMLAVSIFHVILASFEPASIDMRSSNNSYIDMAKDKVLIIESVIVFAYIFDICIARILSTNKIFWKQKLNLSRILCTGVMALDLLLAYPNIGVPRFSRFLRPVQCILISTNLYEKLISVLQAALAAGKPLSLLLLTIFVFSIAGMEFFADSKDWMQFKEEQVDCGFDFRDVYHSFVSLYVLLTTENYPCVMMPAIRGKVRVLKENDDILVDDLNFDLSGYSIFSRGGRNFTQLTSGLYAHLKSEGHVEESRTLHVMFFVTFLLVTTFGVLNVLIASVYNTYRQHAIQTSYLKRTKERKSLLIAYELLTMNKMMTRESVFGSPYESKEDAYLDYLTFRELVKMTMGGRVDEEKLVFYWNKIDTDKSGYVDPLEFLSLVDVLGLTLFRVCETNLAKISVKSIWRTQLKRLILHRNFRYVVLTLLISNAILLCTKGIIDHEKYGTIMIVNDILSLVYLFEMILKIAALGREYWTGVWNQYDCATIFMGVLAAVLRLKSVRGAIDSTFAGTIAVVVIMLSKILRILRIMTIGKKESNQFLLLLFRILPTSLTFLVLTFLVICVYAYIGLEVFSKFNQDNYLQNDYYEFASFSNFSSALMLMFQVLTTSNWHEVMIESHRALAMDMHENLAFIITAVYFISFGILSVNVVLNLMEAVFVDSWRQILDMNKKLKKKLGKEERP